MTAFEERNRHFDSLIATPGLRWMGQNTNHLPPHPAVLSALQESIAKCEFQIYAPPSGLEQLREAIVEDLGLEGAVAHVTDGAVSALYHVVKTLIGPGDTLVTTDPTWSWPILFASEAGASVTQVPIYGEENGYKLSAQRLADAVTSSTRIVYFVDPNNPLGTAADEDEIRAISDVVREANAYLIQDCTYRDFAYCHNLAARFIPERTVTTYSFSKWLGLAGLRVGALVAAPDMVERLATAPPNNLGSNILAQRAALAGLRIKKQWFPHVLEQTRANEKLIREAVRGVFGLRVPLAHSNGNFIIIECEEAGIRPDALCYAFREQGIVIRQGRYHTENFGDRFVKVSTSVPSQWAEEFARLLPEAVTRAREMNSEPKLF